MDIQAKLFFDLIDKDQNGMLSKVNVLFFWLHLNSNHEDRDETVFGDSSLETDRQLSNCSRSGGSGGRCWKDFWRKGKLEQFLGKIKVYWSWLIQLNRVFRKRWRSTSSWLVTTVWWQWSLLIWCRNNKKIIEFAFWSLFRKYSNLGRTGKKVKKE